MPQTLMTISVASFTLSVVAAITALVLFFRLRIKSVIGELTGKTATAEIARIRAEGISRQAKGRSLQSIIGQENSSNSFDLKKLGLQDEPDAQVLPMAEAMQTTQSTQSAQLGQSVEADSMSQASQSDQVSLQTELLGNDSTAEPMTEALDQSKPAVEPMTELLQASNSVEPMTELLQSKQSAEPMTELLQSSQPAEPITELLQSSQPAEPMTELLDDC